MLVWREDEKNINFFCSCYCNFMYNMVHLQDLASLINKSANLNEQNNVLKDSNGNYIDNKQNSISIEIKFIDNDEIIKSEKIYANGMDKFVELYGNSKFNLKKLEYHNKTKIVKYAYFEEQQ